MNKYLHGTTGVAVYSIAALIAAAILATIVIRIANRITRSIRGFRDQEEERAPRNIATPLYILAALIGTGLSTNTSWRFFRKNLGFPDKTVTDRIELIGMFAGLEVILVACAFGARQNLNSAKKKPGAPGVVVWIISGLAAAPAYMVGGSFWPGTWRVLLGPLMAVFAFHGALGMELRHKSPKAQNESVPAVIARELTQRLYARLGLATRDRSALEISRDRALTRAVVLYGRLSAMDEERRTGRRGVRLAVRLREQFRRAGVHDDPARMDLFLSQAAVYQHTGNLFALTFASPWTDRPAVVSADGDDAGGPGKVGPDPDSTGPDPANVLPVPVSGSDDWADFEREFRPLLAPESGPTPTESAPVRIPTPTNPDAIQQGNESPRISGPDLPDSAESSAEGPRISGPDFSDSGSEQGGPRHKRTVTTVVRECVERGVEDTGTITRIVADVLPDARPDTIVRTVRKIRAERTPDPQGPDSGIGNYM